MQNELTAERINAAIEQLKDLRKDRESFLPDNDICADDVAAIDTALAALRAERERQWISVEDRLPDERKSHIVCSDKGAVFTARWWGDHFQPHGECVTHWMPLPGPPTDCGRRLTEGSESK